MPRRDAYTRMNDQRDNNRFHDLLRDETWGGSSHGPNSSGTYGIEGGFVGKGPKNYKRADTSIHDDVCEALTNCPDIDASDVEVTVKDGEVTLTGTVDSRHAKRLSEDIVDNLRGVKDIHNRLEVKR